MDHSFIPPEVEIQSFSNPPISLADLEKEYCRLIGQPYPIREMVFTRSWILFRASVCCSEDAAYFLISHQGAIIAQGIAARYARRQASSERALLYGKMFPVFGAMAKGVLDKEGITIVGQKARL